MLRRLVAIRLRPEPVPFAGGFQSIRHRLVRIESSEVCALLSSQFCECRVVWCGVDCARSMIRLTPPGDQNDGLELLFG